MSLTSKEKKNTYKDLLIIENSNSGFDTNLDSIKSGDGTDSSLSLSTNNVLIKPSADSTSLLNVQDSSAGNLLSVDSTNSYVKAGSSQNHVNTQYAHFGITSSDTAWTGKTENTHTAVPFGGISSKLSTVFTLGTGTDPATSLTISTTADDMVSCLMYLTDNIVVDVVNFWVGSNGATGDVLRCHLMSYDIVTVSGATSGDLSSGTVIADGADISSDGYEQAYYQSMTIQSASVSSGKGLFFTLRQDGTNSDYTTTATIKYHLV